MEKREIISCLRFYFFICIAVFSLEGAALAQSSFPDYPDRQFSTYYHQKATQYKLLPVHKGEIVFLGNSITDGGSWHELFQNPDIVNRGISGDVTVGVLNRLDNVVKMKPVKIFLLIGINDLAAGVTPDSILTNIYNIVSLVQQYSPATKMYVQSLFPVNKEPGRFPDHTNKSKQIKQINRLLEKNAADKGYTFIDVYHALVNKKGSLDLHYTNDGLHLLGAGYLVWKHVLYPYVYGLNDRPALIPKPQQTVWKHVVFPLYKLKDIVITEDVLRPVAKRLQEILKSKHLFATIEENKKPSDAPQIILKLDKVDVPRYEEEAYTLQVDENEITITGNSGHGVFNGVQTLRQLIRDDAFVDGVDIKDWPAFSWRGYMVDVGRNYQHMEQLKQQIDAMAHAKLNVFHFHLTENVAWRLQIKQYPELTKGEYMTRDKGQYYTIAQMKELIQYCKDRFITFVPEIDMPGHSAAFKRAMGFDMQTDSGLKVVKNILKEVSATYDVPYIHIGADEVRFTNKEFIPEVVDLLHKLGKQTIGWAPGGNYDYKTIRQLWKSQKPVKGTDVTIRYVDSRGVYLNHKDPLSGIPLIFHKQIGDVNHGDSSILGGEICVWNDDRARNQKDILQMNAVYPSILAMAERSWIGGGYKGLSTKIGADSTSRYKKYEAFEDRMLDIKKEFFQTKSFPYFKQSDIQWKLFGPFENEGNLTAKFWPELKGKNISDSVADKKVNGATIWLRHFFSPVITGNLEDPRPNTTWYAYRRVYSRVDTIGQFWIGFYNPSRSYAVKTAKEGNWDYRESKVWVNGKLVTPPKWTYPGRNNNSREDPIVDEIYVSRPPTKIPLKKGWNTILVKAPVAGFQGSGWQHKVKWEFTMIRVK